MTQTVVNFLEGTGFSNGNYSVEIDARVFDFEISTQSQTFYTDEITQLQTDVANGNAVGVSTIINTLNNWSNLRLISNGSQTYQVNGVTVPVDANGNPAPTSTAEENPEFTGTDSLTGQQVTLTTTMDQYMAQSLDQIIRTLRAAGWDPTVSPVAAASPSDPNFIMALNALGPIDGTGDPFGIGTLFTQALSASSQANIIDDARTGSQSIQQLLMVDYVSTGNQLLFNQMSQLETAVNTNQSALSYLNSLQALMNEKDPQQFILQLQALNGIQTTGTPQSLFDTFEQDTYNQARGDISNISSNTPQALDSFFNTLANPVVGQMSSTDASTVYAGLTSLLPGVNITVQQQTELQNLAALIATANNTPLPNGNDAVTGVPVTVNTSTGPEVVNALESGDADTIAAGLTALVPNDSDLTSIIQTLSQAYASVPLSSDPLDRGTFQDLTNDLSTVFNYSLSQITGNLNYLVQQLAANGGNATQGLGQALTQVLNDFNSAGSINTWIQDAQAGEQGNYQLDLSSAITSSQSFNDTEQENLRAVMFTFEEFYKSADSLLDNLNQLLDTMAQAIAR